MSLVRQADITQKDLGILIGVDRTSISKYENGQQTPEVAVLTKIAKVFHVSIGELLGEHVEENLSNNDKDLGIAISNMRDMLKKGRKPYV